MSALPTAVDSTDLTLVVVCADDLQDVLTSLESLAEASREHPEVELGIILVGDAEGAAGAATRAVTGVPCAVVPSTGRGRGADASRGLEHVAAGTASLTVAAGERLAPGALRRTAAARAVRDEHRAGEPQRPVWTAASGFPTNRRNLVFLRAGQQSLHWGWTAHERTFDVVVDAWAGNAEDYVGGCDQLYDGLADTWTLAIHRFFSDHPELLEHYDSVWIANDDIDASPQTVEAMFALHSKLGYALAQPALTPDSHVVHSITVQHRGLSVRETSFVETMVPVWRSSALAACLQTYADFPRGHGQDSVWPALLAEVGGRMAIYDCTPVRHTRPAGALGVQGGTLDEALRCAIDTVSRYGPPAGILPKVVHRAWDSDFVELPRERLYCRLEAAFPKRRRSAVLEWDVYAAALAMTREHIDSGVLGDCEEWRGPAHGLMTVLVHCSQGLEATSRTLDSLRESTDGLERLSVRLVLLAADAASAEDLQARSTSPVHDVVIVGDVSSWRAFAAVDVVDGSPTLSLVSGEVVTEDVIMSLLAV